MRLGIYLFVGMAICMAGCRSGGETELERYRALSTERDFRFRAQTLPVILDDLDVFSFDQIYLTSNRQYSPENTAFETTGIIATKYPQGFSSDADTGIVGNFTILTYYRKMNLQPSTIRFSFDIDVTRFKEITKPKDLYPDMIHTVEKILDPAAKSVTVWKDVICELGPIENGRRKIAINATWPIAYKGDRYPFDTRECYELNQNVSGATLHHLYDKVLGKGYELAVQPHYPNNPSPVAHSGRGLVNRNGFILLKNKIVGSFSFSNWIVGATKPMVSCRLYWKKGATPPLKPEVLSAAEGIEHRIEDLDQVVNPSYTLLGDEFFAILPLNSDLKTVVGDENKVARR